MNAFGAGGLSSGWQTRGTWTVPVSPSNVTPTADSVTPNAGSGATQIFSFSYSDANGYADVNGAYALFNSALSAANACYVFFYRPANSLYLANDAGTGSGNNLIVTFSLTFKSPA